MVFHGNFQKNKTISAQEKLFFILKSLAQAFAHQNKYNVSENCSTQKRKEIIVIGLNYTIRARRRLMRIPPSPPHKINSPALMLGTDVMPFNLAQLIYKGHNRSQLCAKFVCFHLIVDELFESSTS